MELAAAFFLIISIDDSLLLKPQPVDLYRQAIADHHMNIRYIYIFKKLLYIIMCNKSCIRLDQHSYSPNELIIQLPRHHDRNP